MQTDQMDALYPVINENLCIDCGLCEKTCPNNRQLVYHKAEKVYAAWSNNKQTRLTSASGGIAYELYLYWIRGGGVATGVVYDRDKGCHFILMEKEDDIKATKNSKYTFSDTNGIYLKVKKKLQENIRVLFVGVPCQVAGLYGFLKDDYANLTTVDIICHGMPPAAYLQQHIEYIERHKKERTSMLSFRDPKYHTYTFTFTLNNKDGKEFCKSSRDNYNLGYHKALIYRENCYSCRYAQKDRIADLTIGDFAGLGFFSHFDFEKKNVSCILQNTKKGEILLQSLGDAISLYERPESEAFDVELQLKHPSIKHTYRETFEKVYSHTHNFKLASSTSLALEQMMVVKRKFNSGSRMVVGKILRMCHINKTSNGYKLLTRLLHRPNVPYGAILMLHRVETPDENGVWYNEHLKMSPNVIEEMAAYARSRGCEFVSLREMTRRHRFYEQPRKLIAVTLDDGYRDNYLNGAPIFNKLGIPYCIYVCTKMVEGKMLYWWKILERLVLKENQISLTFSDGIVKVFDCSSKDSKEKSFLDIREVILGLPQNDLLEQLKGLFSMYDIDYDMGNDVLGLTWEQVRKLAKESLCTIGNHTYSHKAFAGCTDKEIEKDIENAAKKMKNRTGCDMQDFAFPFGDEVAVTMRDLELVKGLGFTTSATTKDGLVCYGTDKLELPRLFVTEKNWKLVIDRIAENC